MHRFNWWVFISKIINNPYSHLHNFTIWKAVLRISSLTCLFEGKGIIQTEITVLLVGVAVQKNIATFLWVWEPALSLSLFIWIRAHPGWEVEPSSTVICDRCPWRYGSGYASRCVSCGHTQNPVTQVSQQQFKGNSRPACVDIKLL